MDDNPVNNCWKDELKLMNCPRCAGFTTLMIIACAGMLRPVDNENHNPKIASIK